MKKQKEDAGFNLSCRECGCEKVTLEWDGEQDYYRGPDFIWIVIMCPCCGQQRRIDNGDDTCLYSEAHKGE